MADNINGNRRQDFRVEDLLPMRDKPITPEVFEFEKRHIGIRSRQSALLRNMVGNDIFSGAPAVNQEDSEVARVFEALDAKLNYLIGVNMLNDANRNDLDERPVNISATGMSFVSTHAYKEGDYTEVTLMLPALPPMVMELLGAICRSGERPDGRFDVGIVFHFRCDDEQDQMARYVFRRHREMIRMELRERQFDARVLPQ